jgi:hypothetical protein
MRKTAFSSKRGRKGRRSNRNLPLVRATRETIDHPPQLNDYSVSHGKTLRFTVTAAVTNQSITFANLLDAILVATTATVGKQLFDVVKVRRVTIWAAAALGTPTTTAITFLGNTNAGDDSIHTDTSLGFKPSYVSARPGPKTLASFFNASGAVIAFTLTAPAGSIIDIHLTYRTSVSAPVTVANALVAATAGEIYFRGLDGVAAATTNFPVPNGINAQ